MGQFNQKLIKSTDVQFIFMLKSDIFDILKEKG